MKFWPEPLGVRSSNEKYYLLGIFFILVAIKSILTFSSQTPWIFIDEGVYDSIAQNIFKGTFFSDSNYYKAFPPGYSVFLSIAYLFSGDKTIIYHIMLIINSILSSSILFPSYFILKKYISQQQALLGSFLISVLPAVTIFTFILMSENLFLPLTMFSIWFLHEAFENNKMLWDFLAALSVFYLYFTRETGFVFVIAVLMALAFFIFFSERGARLKVIKDKAVLICALAIPLLLWIIYKIITISRTSFYAIDRYTDIFMNAFSNPLLFERFSVLMLHETEYLVLSSYVIFFIISLIFISGCLFRLKLFGFNDYLQQFCPGKVLALQSVIIYCLAFSAGLLVITVTFMHTLGIPSIYGRYIDPIVPGIFLFGIIGIGFLNTKYTDSKWKSEILFCLGISILILFVYTLPHTFFDAFPNAFGAYYIIYLQEFLSYSFSMVLLAIVFVFIPYYLLKNSHKNHFLIIFFLFFIVLSAILSVPIYEINNNNMRYAEGQLNQIGRYLQEHSSPDTQILMDSQGDAWNQKWYLAFTQFWTFGKIIRRSTDEDASGVFTKEFVDKADYIISQKVLPYPCVIASNNDYKLYTPHATGTSVQDLSLPLVIDMGSNTSTCLIDGFYQPEGKFRWTRGSSQVKIEHPKKDGSFILHVNTGGMRPENNPANVTFFMNGHYIGAMENTGGTEIYSVLIPEYYLESNYQILEIRTNTWKPSDYGSADSRNLGITVESIRSDDISFDEMFEEESWNSVPSRWMSDNATLLIYSDENRLANFTFRAISFYQTRSLEIYYDDTLRTTQRVIPAGFVNVSTQLPLQKGENTIRLHVPGGCDRPVDISELNNGDTRCLSIGVQKVILS